VAGRQRRRWAGINTVCVCVCVCVLGGFGGQSEGIWWMDGELLGGAWGLLGEVDRETEEIL